MSILMYDDIMYKTVVNHFSLRVIPYSIGCPYPNLSLQTKYYVHARHRKRKEKSYNPCYTITNRS